MPDLKCDLQVKHPRPSPPSFGSAVSSFTGHAVQLAAIHQKQIEKLQEDVASLKDEVEALKGRS
jgi:hypothetical protein